MRWLAVVLGLAVAPTVATAQAAPDSSAVLLRAIEAHCAMEYPDNWPGQRECADRQLDGAIAVGELWRTFALSGDYPGLAVSFLGCAEAYAPGSEVGPDDNWSEVAKCMVGQVVSWRKANRRGGPSIDNNRSGPARLMP